MTQQLDPLHQAHAYFEQGRWDLARLGYEEALSQGDDAFAYARLGTIHRFQGSLFEGRRCFKRALELDEDNATYRAGLGNFYLVTGQTKQGLQLLRQAVAQAPDNAEILSSYLFNAHYDPHVDCARLFQEHCRWGQRHGPMSRAWPDEPRDLDSERRLRVGYLGADFKQHSVGYTLGPILRRHHRNEVEVYGYASVAQSDAMARQMEQYFDVYHAIHRWDDEQVARQIRADGIDLLLVVGGHSFGHRLGVLAYRPAPIQIDYGGINTVGLAQVDARLTDVQRDPPAAQRYFLEKLVYLPEGSTCYQPPSAAPAVNPLPALKTGHLTLGACHGAQKINAVTLSLWGQVLNTLPESRLIIKCAGGQESTMQSHLHAVLADQGVDPQRVTVCGLWSNQSHLRFYHQIDLALDATPFNGGVTTLEGMWMGVPIVSLTGSLSVSRTGLSLLHQVGLSALAVDTPERFIKTAAVLAEDLPSLAKIRTSLRSRMASSVLCQADRYVTVLEQTLRSLWCDYVKRRNNAEPRMGTEI